MKHWEFEKVFSLIIDNLKKTSFRINNDQKFFVRLDPGLLKKAGIGTRARLFCYAPIWLSSSEEYFFSHIKDLKESELISSGKEISKDLQIGTTTSLFRELLCNWLNICQFCLKISLQNDGHPLSAILLNTIENWPYIGSLNPYLQSFLGFFKDI